MDPFVVVDEDGDVDDVDPPEEPVVDEDPQALAINAIATAEHASALRVGRRPALAPRVSGWTECTLGRPVIAVGPPFRPVAGELVERRCRRNAAQRDAELRAQARAL